MDGLFDDIELAFSDFGWANALEVTAIALVFYALLRLLRGTTAMSVVRGMVFVAVAVAVLGRIFDSVVLDWMVANALTVLLILVLLVFQPEFRRAFEHVGRAGLLKHWGSNRQPYRVLVSQVATVSQRMSQRQIGALFVFERETGLDELAGTGVRLGSTPSAELLQSIFWPGSPLHDGAVLLRPLEVVAASVIIPTPLADLVGRDLQGADSSDYRGTRHRAAMAISEETDAVAVVVSEESGAMSVAIDGMLTQVQNAAELETLLAQLLNVRSWSDRIHVRRGLQVSERSRESTTASGDATGS